MAWFTKKTPETPAATPTGPGRPPQALKVGPLLDPSVILFPGPTEGKVQILESLCSAVCRRAGIASWDGFLAKALEREQGISTTLDTGLSLPHARMDGIEGILAGMAVLKAPITDPKQPDLTIRVVFLFFSPNRPDAFPLHLQLLRGVSSLFQPALIDQLSAAPGPAEALALIRKVEG